MADPDKFQASCSALRFGVVVYMYVGASNLQADLFADRFYYWGTPTIESCCSFLFVLHLCPIVILNFVVFMNEEHRIWRPSRATHQLVYLKEKERKFVRTRKDQLAQISCRRFIKDLFRHSAPLTTNPMRMRSTA